MMMHHFIRRSLISMGILVLPIVPSLVFAHGYVLKPESRAYACKLNKNTQ